MIQIGVEWMKMCRLLVAAPADRSRKLLQELVADRSRALINLDLHGRDFGVNLLHELDHEINEFMLPHGLKVEVGKQKRYVVAL